MTDKATKKSASTAKARPKASEPEAQQRTNPVDPPWPAAGPISGSPDGRAVGGAPSDNVEADED